MRSLPPSLAPLGLSLLFGLAACSDASGPTDRATPPTDEPKAPIDPDPQFDLYPRSQLMEVEITLADADWAVLKSEGRTINEVFSGCTTEGFDYTKFEASVRIGQHRFDSVSVRKKGYLGSISSFRPSLRIDLDHFVHDQSLGGGKAITLNNSQSDRSYAAQCLSYEQFAAAGIAAPRCGYARVTVNGESLGVYVSVEPVKKPFLRDHFGDDEGDLYEGGGGADFRDDMLVHFEKKTNEAEPQSPKLKAVADALNLPDEQLLSALAPLLDVDEFLRFWAVESLVGHWDGYTGDLNNFFVYLDPTQDGKLRFIPWGTDNAYEERHPFLPAVDWPRSAYAWARLPRRLYALPETRARYQAILREELDKHWDTAALDQHIDAIASVTGESVDAGTVEALRKVIAGRRALLLAELDGPAKPWNIPERQLSACRADAESAISVSFSTAWGDLASTAPTPGNTATGTVQGSALSPVYVIAAAGESTDPAAPGRALRITVGNPDGTFTLFQLQLGGPPPTPGALRLHGFEVFGFVLTGVVKDGVPMTRTVGYIGEGSITFDAVSTTPGAPVSGHLDVEIVNFAAQPASMPATMAM